MVTQQRIHIETTADRQRAIATLTQAFRNDPVCRWVWPANEDYDRYFPLFAEAFAGGAFEHGSAYATSGAGGIALWLPPGALPDNEALGELLVASIASERQEEAFAFLGRQEEQHPQEQLWYLPLIGVEPDSQGRGYGSQLLEHTLAIVDRDGLPAYLEATSPNNRALYARHGFEVTGEIQYGSSPAMWPMYRKPR